MSQLGMRINAFCQSNIPLKQFIIIIPRRITRISYQYSFRNKNTYSQKASLFKEVFIFSMVDP